MLKIQPRSFLYLLLIFFTAGCATTTLKPQKDLAKFYAEDPRSILIVPVMNESVSVDASAYFLTTISVPLAEDGYYVFPINMVRRVLEDDGLSDAYLIHEAPTEQLCSMFGAESVLYIVIRRWDARYVVLSTHVTVEFDYKLKGCKSGDVLWTHHQVMEYVPQTSSSGNGIADLIVMAVNAAVTKAKPNYRPLAEQANYSTFSYPGPGLPPGPYLESYVQGGTSQVIKKNPEQPSLTQEGTLVPLEGDSQ